MGTKVSVNMRTVVHKKSTGMAISFPDVCKTPTPGGPIPIPYPNIAKSGDASKTSKKVKCDGEGICVKGSNFMLSTGDEAGSAMGIASNKIKGKAEFQNFSFDVKVEGKTVARLGDPMTQNAGSTPNAMTPAEAQVPAPAVGASGDQDACDRLAKKGVPEQDRDQAAQDHGMLPEHADAMRDACQSTGKSATVRQTNPDCLDRIRDGFPTKPAGGAGDSISDAANLPSECRGLVGQVDRSTGQISGVHSASGLIPADEINAARGRMSGPEFTDWMRGRGAQTGDYDLHDIFDGRGRVHDSTNQARRAEQRFMNEVNDAMGRTDPQSRMVQHGPQANFSEHLDNNPAKRDKLLDAFGQDKLDRVMQPDVCRDPSKPLMHFDKNGEMYKIETEAELKDLYACKGASYPANW